MLDQRYSMIYREVGIAMKAFHLHVECVDLASVVASERLSV
jgi:hypothetical protein